MTDDDSAPEAPRRRRPVQREHLLQVAIRHFARDAIDLHPDDYLFVAFDSAQKSTDNQRARMVSRGVLPGFPDCGLFLNLQMAVFAEIKWHNGKVSPEQDRVLSQLRALGHYADVVRTVDEYRKLLNKSSVPLRNNAALIAADLDLKVQARIAAAESRAASPGGGRVRSAPRFTAGKRLGRRMNLKGMG